MTSKPVAFLLADLGVTKSHSRPHVSNDNPYSEAQCQTMKYRPDFPARFSSIEDARACRGFLPLVQHRALPQCHWTAYTSDVHHQRPPPAKPPAPSSSPRSQRRIPNASFIAHRPHAHYSPPRGSIPPHHASSLSKLPSSGGSKSFIGSGDQTALDGSSQSCERSEQDDG